MNENEKNFADDDDDDTSMFGDDEELRDQFAALALCGLLSNGNIKMSFNDPSSPGTIAKRSYDFADAMMKARKKLQ